MKEDYPIINSKIKSITFEIFNTSGNEITQDRDTPSVDILFTYQVVFRYIQSYLVISDGSIVLQQPLDVVRHLDEDTGRPGLAPARCAEYHDTCTQQYSVFTILQIFLYRPTYSKILKAACGYHHNPQLVLCRQASLFLYVFKCLFSINL